MRHKAHVTLAAYIVCYFKTSLVWKVSKTNTETYHAQVLIFQCQTDLTYGLRVEAIDSWM